MFHIYKLGGYNIVLDVNSGAVHSVDELTYLLLDFFPENPPEACPTEALAALGKDYSAQEIEETYSELLELYGEKLLNAPDTYEKYAKFAVPSPIKAMCLHIAHDCNLRCGYCFASTGGFGGTRRLMSFDTGRRAIDFLLEKSGDRENLEMDFFGGEPLMNFEVVKQLVGYARSKEAETGKKFRFTITTNGMLLDDDKIDFINREMSNVVLSIDGRREINDNIRKRIDGTGCYDKIVPLFRKLTDARGDKEYYVRGTFTRYNLDFSEDIFHLYECGFDQISVEPVVSEPEAPYSLTEAQLSRIFEEYERLAQRIRESREKGEWFNFFHFMLDLDDGPCAIKRLRGCGSGNEYVAITPEGDIYPCHQFVGVNEFKMGNLYDGSFDEAMKAKFAAAHVYSKEKCRNCWAKFYCSGGCNANNQLYAGDILTPLEISCELERKRLECAIMLQVHERSQND